MDPVVALKLYGKSVWSMDDSQKFKVNILKASYGVTGDPMRTRDVTKKVQTIADAGSLIIQVSEMAKDDDPAFGIVKTLKVDFSIVDFSINSEIKKVSGTDEQSINLLTIDSSLPEAEISANAENNKIFSGYQAGNYEFITTSGKTKKIHVKANSEVKEISGPWNVFFDPKTGGPGEIVFSKLDDWSQRAEEGIKFYSGTAIYKTTFVAPSISKTKRVVLDLGKVAMMAEVKINGKDLGICWKSPYLVDVTDVIKKGRKPVGN